MKRFFPAFFIFFAAATTSIKASPNVKGVNEAFSSIAGTLTAIVPENTTAMITTPEAYVGKLYPSIPKHFSIGISTSGTFVDTSVFTDRIQFFLDDMKASVATIGGSLSIDFPSLPPKLPVPTTSIQARFGGILYPFDIGLFATTTGKDLLKFNAAEFGIALDYTALGAEVRYAVLQGSVFIPQVSLGFGYSFHTQDLKISTSKEISYAPPSTNTGNLSSVSNIFLRTHTIFASAQISRRFLFTIPFLGIRAIMTKSDASYGWSYTTTQNGTKVDSASAEGSGSLSKNFDFAGIKPQIFGGLTLTFPYFEMGFYTSWNILTNYFSGAVSMNVKI